MGEILLRCFERGLILGLMIAVLAAPRVVGHRPRSWQPHWPPPNAAGGTPKLGSLLTHYRAHGIAARGLPVPGYSNAPAVATVCARIAHRRIRRLGILAESSRYCRTRDPLVAGSSARDRRPETISPSCLPSPAQWRAHANALGWCAISVRPGVARVLSGHVDCDVREVPDTTTPSRRGRARNEDAQTAFRESALGNAPNAHRVLMRHNLCIASRFVSAAHLVFCHNESWLVASWRNSPQQHRPSCVNSVFRSALVPRNKRSEFPQNAHSDSCGE
jgi:hypothetical protein